MNIFRLAIELFLLYLAYKLIFDFIIPVYKTTKQMKQKMADIREKMEQQNQANQRPEPPKPTTAAKSSVGGDYIDYEEIK